MIYKSFLWKSFSAVFFLLFSSHTLWAQHFTFLKNKEGIEISENGRKVLFYQAKQKSVDGKYERAGYVHPLYDLNGNILTEDMPADHPYHRGIFWAWHQIVLNDKNVADGWTSDSISWKTTNVTAKKGDSTITINAEVQWNLKSSNDRPKTIVKENTIITIFKSTANYRVIDFDISLLPLVDHLKIGGSDDEKGYGGFCLRLKLPKDLAFNSLGKKVTPEETYVYAGPWMDFTGTFNEKTPAGSGVTVFGYSSEANKKYPWILRSSESRSMQNVPFPRRTPIDLPAKGLRLFYRIIVHDNKLSNDEIEKLYDEYVNRPAR
ncbi:MAG: DUF6807 family protein [Ginsengibacter sp.]